MNVISALNNQLIQDNLKYSFPDITFLLPDISYQDGILEVLKNNLPDALIINLAIEGDLDRKSFIEALRKINDTVNILLIAKSSDKEYSNWLVTKGVYDVFVDGQCSFQDIYEALIREQKVIVKTEIRKEYVEKEKVITKEKVVKEIVPVGFKKLVLTVWANAEFACELAYFAAKLTNYRVLLANLDFMCPTPGIYLNLRNSTNESARDPPQSIGLGMILDTLEKGKLTLGIFENTCHKRKEISNLYILPDSESTEPDKGYQSKDIASIIDNSYSLFDVVVLIAGKSVYDTISATTLLKSDHNIIPMLANADCIKEFESCFLYMNMKYHVPIEKCRFIAWEYKRGVNYPVGYLKDIFTESRFLGTISYSEQRESYRNIDAAYVKWLFRKNPGEYIDILSKFSIVPKIAFKYKIKCWFLSKYRNWYKRLRRKPHISHKSKMEANENHE